MAGSLTPLQKINFTQPWAREEGLARARQTMGLVFEKGHDVKSADRNFLVVHHLLSYCVEQ